MLGRGVAVVDWSLALDMDVGDPHEESFHLSCPLQSASVLLAMARHRLQCVRLPEPVVAVTVWTSRTQPFAGVQEDLLDGSAAAREPLHALLSRLSAALGAEAVHSQHSADRHRPERAVRRAPFQPTHRPPPVSMPKGARPTRLLHTPEALEIRRESRVVIWRGRRWHFVHLGAPERISGEWWEEPFHRDYHVMWLEEGGRWWIHWDRRVGEWRLHGFFE
jgi:protein ImuB